MHKMIYITDICGNKIKQSENYLQKYDSFRGIGNPSITFCVLDRERIKNGGLEITALTEESFDYRNLNVNDCIQFLPNFAPYCDARTIIQDLLSKGSLWNTNQELVDIVHRKINQFYNRIFPDLDVFDKKYLFGIFTGKYLLPEPIFVEPTKYYNMTDSHNPSSEPVVYNPHYESEIAAFRVYKEEALKRIQDWKLKMGYKI